MESGNSTAEDSCPSVGGLRHAGLFGQPSFNFLDVWQHPTYNWHIVGWLACLLFLVITWSVALTLVIRHLRNYYDPQIQRHKLRIILYPPVYATLAWASYLRFDYATTILFFATLFEAFAVYNLYTCLQAYLAPYREEAQGRKEALSTKVLFLFKVNLKSKWGMHFRIIIDILVYQFPIWAIIDALVSLITQSRGLYCESSFSFRGAHVYLVIINFTSLSIILTALFTYLAVFSDQWKAGDIHAHGMFWCVKGPIMAIFYLGELLLSGLVYADVIKGTDGTHSSDHLPWTADEVKSGIYVIVICVTMCIAMLLMLRYFNVDRRMARASPDDNVGHYQQLGGQLTPNKLSPWMAFVDAYLIYIPEFLRNVLCCGVDSFRLARKRIELRARKKRAGGLADAGEHMLATKESYQDSPGYPMSPNYPTNPPPSTYYPSYPQH
ncbi:organic solute transporter Ostalpha-domain-containing protein [Halteromyces radiatus]|uniref:organic solute transporter Ostalpha-domain-containing protein n=1 Tax=Halteromyces radiatus TaxID=101107 RepID=UPI00222028B0|nr:organic solute transporter Ostalpha-domain-containing protein [Halteromyces radiatus]KAI8096463.1 organic solute transporter Ostalpha-domain-containing protein [Halteromyces radiatus]